MIAKPLKSRSRTRASRSSRPRRKAMALVQRSPGCPITCFFEGETMRPWRSIRRCRRRLARHRGAVIVLIAFVLVLTVAIIAFAVDGGVLVLARGELQRAADSAALAGAWEAIEKADLSGDPFNADVQAAVNTEVEAYVGRHSVFGKPLTIRTNPSNEADGDIAMGTWSSRTFSVENSVDINSVRVVTLRTRSEERRVG